MSIYALGSVEPRIHPDAYVHPDAVLIGDVRVGAQASVWPTAVLRGDSNYIEIGERSSVQDGTIVHCSSSEPTIVGSDCTIGHIVHIEGAVIGAHCLISSGSVVLNGARIGDGAVVAAGAVVAPGTEVPPRRMAVGVPARVRDGYEVPEGTWDYAVETYLRRSKRYRAELRRLDPPD